MYKPDGLCPEDDGVSGRDASSQALRDYFDGLSLEKGLGMPLDDTKLDKSKSRKLLTELEHLGGNKYEAMFSLFSTSPIEFRHQGDLDGKGRFSGYTVLRVSGKESCYRGKCAFPTYMRIAGHFVDGELQGPVSLISRENM